MLSTIFAQPPKVPKLDPTLLDEQSTTVATDVLECIDEIQCFDAQDGTTTTDPATQAAVKRFIGSKAEFDELGSLINEICAQRISAAVQERDDMWRRHETAQISYLQNENSQMLTGLHAEIEKLHHHLRDLYRRLYVKHSFDSNMKLENENDELRKRLELAEQNTDNLNKKLEECEKKSRTIEQQFNETIKMLKNQLAYQGNRIRQLTDELRERTAQIAKLMAQLPFGTLAEKTEKEVPTRIRFHSQPAVVCWNPAPASFFGKKNNTSKNLPRIGLTRSISVSYPGGRPNVVAQRYSYTSSTPRSHHLPPLYWKPRSAAPGSGCSIEKPSRPAVLTARDRMSLTRSLYEIQNSALANSVASSSNSSSTKSKNSISIDDGPL